MKTIPRSKSCLYMPTMRCTHRECITANGQAKDEPNKEVR